MGIPNVVTRIQRQFGVARIYSCVFVTIQLWAPTSLFPVLYIKKEGRIIKEKGRKEEKINYKREKQKEKKKKKLGERVDR